MSKQAIRGLLIVVSLAMLIGSAVWGIVSWLYEYWDYIVINRPSPIVTIQIIGFLGLIVAAAWKLVEREENDNANRR